MHKQLLLIMCWQSDVLLLENYVPKEMAALPIRFQADLALNFSFSSRLIHKLH